MHILIQISGFLNIVQGVKNHFCISKIYYIYLFWFFKYIFCSLYIILLYYLLYFIHGFIKARSINIIQSVYDFFIFGLWFQVYLDIVYMLINLFFNINIYYILLFDHFYINFKSLMFYYDSIIYYYNGI